MMGLSHSHYIYADGKPNISHVMISSMNFGKSNDIFYIFPKFDRFPANDLPVSAKLPKYRYVDESPKNIKYPKSRITTDIIFSDNHVKKIMLVGFINQFNCKEIAGKYD